MYFNSYKTEMDEVRNLGNYVLSQFDKNLLNEKQTLESFIDTYSKTRISVIASDHKDAATTMLLDRIFRNETLQNPAMYPALKRQDKLDLEAIEGVFTALNSDTPEEDAIHLMSLLGYLSEKLLHEGYTDEMKAYASRMIKNLLNKTLNPTQTT